MVQTSQDGLRELRSARSAGWHLLFWVALFSAAVNLLNLTGPLFMMQVYDRVLGSRSVETLAALFVLVAFLFLMMGLLDLARNRVMARLAARFHDRLEVRVFGAALQEGAASGNASASQAGLSDLESIQRLISSPVLLALFDLPWAPMFLAGLFIFHPLLGVVACLGGVVLVIAALLNQMMAQAPLRQSFAAGQQADRSAALYRDEGELIGALGMRGASLTRWQRLRARAAEFGMQGTDRSAAFTVFSRTFRLFLQSALLAAGAWLVLQGKLTPGAMIAASILMGRALAPIEQIVGGWSLIQRAQDGWARLGRLLSRRPAPAPRTPLPRPAARLEVSGLTVVPPGANAPTLRGVGFAVQPGQALGVIGSSGAGKSTLARALIGAWPPAGGAIRLDGATLDQYDPDVLGSLIGYLPQQVTLFDGTVAENIARLSPSPDAAAVVRAATQAAAHRMILDLPQGYDTPVAQAGARLSGGQIQRIGLARALYRDPALFVLDEPNSNLDNEGSQALNLAIRQIKARGGAVIIMAHRPAAIAECDLLLVMEGGSVRAFGPRDEVLRTTVRNAEDIARPASAGPAITGPTGPARAGGIA
ncbi:type I secretion system permease/ATPase [Paracoccus sp. Z118]|uniref:type I secretion system permease/ATPase n=1 Tax=Paracoccus sp. Z118 TaxID=2851017 RepID=UPI001C2B9ED7|nr:type I secretion system permease/ATPase [Paracoccus sp. Z118]MBV0892979.1 type I secretion system permease/ATPase [Paracoccus sp. Z118]